MPIDKQEIEKYIFDPNNPKQCKSYNLLLRTAKRDNKSFFSPGFLQYFFGDDILNDDFKNELWDLPQDYNHLSFTEKINLYIKQLSQSDLNEFNKNIDASKINTNKISKYSFFKQAVFLKKIKNFCYIADTNNKEFKEAIKKEIFSNDNIDYYRVPFNSQDYDNNFIIFSENYFTILIAKILKSSIFITLEKNIDDFIKYQNNKNIKPIFLKKIEDIDILLNVLENDITKQISNDIVKENINLIDSIKINDFFSISNLKIDNLKDKKEIYILGENGDGKTLLLQAIAVALKGVQKDGQEAFRNIKSEFKVKVLDSDANEYSADENHTYKNMFAYGANRNNSCQIKEDETGYLSLFNANLDLKNPIEWLITLDHSESRGDKNIISVEQAKKLIQNILNSDVEIEIKPTKVTFREKKGSVIEFEQLSAGYKGVITIICDMLVRLSSNQPYVTDIKEYQGIVLIDEVELHLHPKWKYDFVKKIRELFPLIQFIFTTHSPTVILGASSEAVFYKIYKEDGEVCISNQIKNEGYTNNSLISSPLFDLNTITSRDFENKNISSDDYIYSKIHKVIADKIKENININEDEILKLIDKELDNL